MIGWLNQAGAYIVATSTKQDFSTPLAWRGFRRNLLSGVALTSMALSSAGLSSAFADPPAGAPSDAKKREAAETVIVTAQRRVQNLQDVPVSIQVLSGATLKKLNVENFDDLIGQLPNVTAAGFGPGQENI